MILKTRSTKVMFRHWTNALEYVKFNPSGLCTGVLVLRNRRIDATIKAAANVIVKHTSMRLRARRKLTTGTTFTRLARAVYSNVITEWAALVMSIR